MQCTWQNLAKRLVFFDLSHLVLIFQNNSPTREYLILGDSTLPSNFLSSLNRPRFFPSGLGDIPSLYRKTSSSSPVEASPELNEVGRRRELSTFPCNKATSLMHTTSSIPSDLLIFFFIHPFTSLLPQKVGKILFSPFFPILNDLRPRIIPRGQCTQCGHLTSSSCSHPSSWVDKAGYDT